MFLALVVAGIAFIVGGSVAIERLLRPPAGVKRILAAPRTAIADVADATDVRIEGIVEAIGETRESPISGVRCVYFEHHVHARDDLRPGELTSGDGYRELHRFAVGVPFAVRDATGHAIIDPGGATVLLPLHDPADRPGRPPGDDRLTPIVSRRSASADERVIRPGDRLVVIGRAVREPDPDARAATAAYREGPATRLRFTHSRQFPLHLLAPGEVPDA